MAKDTASVNPSSLGPGDAGGTRLGEEKSKPASVLSFSLLSGDHRRATQRNASQPLADSASDPASGGLKRERNSRDSSHAEVHSRSMGNEHEAIEGCRGGYKNGLQSFQWGVHTSVGFAQMYFNGSLGGTRLGSRFGLSSISGSVCAQGSELGSSLISDTVRQLSTWVGKELSSASTSYS
ncbi:hypothetical protein DL96DRAFT_1554373 [Flagelloscypha sp. PMI_526]|nr:hypothetical protein DL96DRAFT_1554373 [Flagelloscypha sp. PMI_526]